MKIKYFFLVSFITIGACNNSETPTSKTSIAIQNDSSADNSFSENIINLQNGLKDTLIPEKEFEKIAEKLESCNISKTEIEYIKLAFTKAYQSDRMEKEVYKYADSLFQTQESYLKKKYPDSTSTVSLYNARSNEELLQANEAIKNFQNFDNSVKLGLQPSPGSLNYLSSIHFDVSNDALRTFAELYRNGGNPPIINGIRIYIAKETSAVNAKDYKLILVGIKDGTDVFYPTTGGPLMSIQNYGQPCRPSCPGARLPF